MRREHGAQSSLTLSADEAFHQAHMRRVQALQKSTTARPSSSRLMPCTTTPRTREVAGGDASCSRRSDHDVAVKRERGVYAESRQARSSSRGRLREWAVPSSEFARMRLKGWVRWLTE